MMTEKTPEAAAAEAPEFSRRVTVERLPDLGRHWKLEANETERAALAARLGIDALEGLTAELHAKPFAGGDLIRLSGHLRANIVQSCVVTLQPIHGIIEETVERTYSFNPPAELPLEMEWSVEDEDLPDPVVEGEIDLGEAVAEQLALAIDPYPRAEGVAFDLPADVGPGISVNGPEKENPFAALADLKNKNR